MCLFLLDQKFCCSSLGVQGVGGDGGSLEVEIPEEVADFRNLVGFGGDFPLGDDRPFAMEKGAQELDGGALLGTAPLSVFPSTAMAFFPEIFQNQAPSVASSASAFIACRRRRIAVSEGTA